ncbi:hypothetical protein ACOSQ2_017768 [Xanthoceras sorbifolium]
MCQHHMQLLSSITKVCYYGRLECSPMEEISVSSNPNPSLVRKWKKMARISKKQILGPSSPIQKIFAARIKGRSGSCSSGRKSLILKLSLPDSPEDGSKRKGSSVFLAGKGGKKAKLSSDSIITVDLL